MRFLITGRRRASHDVVIDIIIVDFGTIVDGRVGNVAAYVIDNVCHYLAILLCNCGSLLDHLL